MRGKIVGAFCAMAAVLLAASCNPNTYKNVNYFQDVAQDSSWTVPVTGGIIIQPKDQISIIVSSGRPELAAQFNLPVVSYQAGSESASVAAISGWWVMWWITRDISNSPSWAACMWPD